MARGEETNLLFSPPRIRKARPTFIGDRGVLPGAADDLFVTEYFTIMRDPLGNLRILDEAYRADTSSSHRAAPPSTLAASEELLVFGDAHGFTIRNFITEGKPLSFKPGLEQDPRGLHLARQELFEVHYLDEENFAQESLVISKTPISRDPSPGWQLAEKYTISSKNFSFLHKGEKSLLLFRDERGRNNVIFFDEHGPDRPLLLEKPLTLSLTENKEPLISPGAERGSCFTVSRINEEGTLELAFTETSSGLLKTEPILELSAKEQVFDITTRGDRGLLLTRDRLYLFRGNPEGVEKIWRLDDLTENYDRLIWTKENEALLWQEGGTGVQKLNLDAP